MSSPVPLLCLLAVYVYGCLKAGPRYMRDREPYKLTNTLIIYNALQVVGSALLFWEVSGGLHGSTAEQNRGLANDCPSYCPSSQTDAKLLLPLLKPNVTSN